MYLADNLQKALRDLGKISQNEVVSKQGDKFIATDILTQSRRIIEIDTHILEAINQTSHKNFSGKRVLKG